MLCRQYRLSNHGSLAYHAMTMLCPLSIFNFSGAAVLNRVSSWSTWHDPNNEALNNQKLQQWYVVSSRRLWSLSPPLTHILLSSNLSSSQALGLLRKLTYFASSSISSSQAVTYFTSLSPLLTHILRKHQPFFVISSHRLCKTISFATYFSSSNLSSSQSLTYFASSSPLFPNSLRILGVKSALKEP